MNINLNINVNVNLNQSTQLISYNNTPNTPNPSSSPHEQIESIREYVNKLYSDIGSAMR